MSEVAGLMTSGRLGEAEALARTLLEMAAADDAADSDAAGALLHLLSASLQRTGDRQRLPEARSAAEKALSIRERVHGADDVRVAKTLVQLGIVTSEMGDLAAARRHHERALTIQERARGPEHPDVVWSLNHVGILADRLGDHEAARGYLARALAAQERLLGPDHADLAGTLVNLSMAERGLGDVAGATLHLEHAQAIQEKTKGRMHPDVARTLGNRGLLASDTGDLAAAKGYLDESLAIFEGTLGPEHPALAPTVTLLGSVAREMADHETARRLAERSLAIREASFGKGSLQAAEGLASLANVLGEVGDLASAIRHHESALAIQERELGPGHGAVGISLLNLGIAVRDAGDPATAQSHFERSLAILERVGGAEHLNVGRALNALGTAAMAQSDRPRALRLLERALAIQERALGPEHADVARILANVSRVHRGLGDVASARQAAERAVAIDEVVLGGDHPRLAHDLAGLASLLLSCGDAAALASALRAEAIGRRHLEVTLQALSEREALRHALARPSGLATALSLAAHSPRDAELARAAWDAALRSRALVLDEMASRHAAVPDEPAARALSAALARSRQRLASVWIRGMESGPPDSTRRLMDEARAEVDKAERELAAVSSRFRSARDRQRAGLVEVLAALPAETALVAFFEYVRHEPGTRDAPAGWEGVPSFVAFVAEGASGDVATIPLGSAAEIDDLVARWRTASIGGAASAGGSRREGASLRERVWDSIASRVGKAQRVLVVPDGSLHLVNLGALPRADGGWLVETGPVIHQLSSERDVLAGGHAAGRGLLALGAPEFAGKAGPASAAVLAGPEPGADEPEVLLASARPQRRSGRAGFAHLSFEPLPGAVAELRESVALWRKRAPPSERGVTSLVGSVASESALLAGAPGKRVLHLATHGFFLGGDGGGSARTTLRGLHAAGLQVTDRPPLSDGESPLLLSGLALAGANRRAQAGPEEDDGIITAQEVASLDLSGVEWAVLSACGTGLGNVRAGEGVLGLERAFRVAGARTVIMSLWSVDDEATRQWMREFYRARLVRQRDTAECVREASLAVLRDRRAKGLDDSPFWWGAFVASGDWR